MLIFFLGTIFVLLSLIYEEQSTTEVNLITPYLANTGSPFGIVAWIT